MPERHYELHVRGDKNLDRLRGLPDVTVGPPEIRTVLYGDHLDQAALHGLLHQLESLGVELVEVRAVPRWDGG